jgi:hypothetical protein
MITINIDKAKEIKKDRLREERKHLLEQLDIDYMRAMEQGIETTDIVNEKQRLRDITNLVDTCNSVEELKTISCENT